MRSKEGSAYLPEDVLPTPALFIILFPIIYSPYSLSENPVGVWRGRVLYQNIPAAAQVLYGEPYGYSIVSLSIVGAGGGQRWRIQDTMPQFEGTHLEMDPSKPIPDPTRESLFERLNTARIRLNFPPNSSRVLRTEGDLIDKISSEKLNLLREIKNTILSSQYWYQWETPLGHNRSK